MSQYLKSPGKFTSRYNQSSKLVLKKVKSLTGYSDAISPVLPKAGSVTLSPQVARELGPTVKLEDCTNTFIAGSNLDNSRADGSERWRLTTAAASVKGCNRVVQRFQNVHKIYSRESHVYQCDFFRLMYFPPDHFLSMFRKSKPAVNVRTVGQVFLNGRDSAGDGGSRNVFFQPNSQKNGFHRTQSTINGLGKLFESNPSNIPRNYAFLRRNLRVQLRKCFIKEWCLLKGDLAVQEALSSKGAGSQYTDSKGRSGIGIAKDGYYMYQVLIFPDKATRKEFECHVEESVQVVSRLDWDEFLKSHSPKAEDRTWVQLANDRVRTASLNRSLESNDIPFALKRIRY